LNKAETYAEVIIPVSLPKLYTYRVPYEFLNEVETGKRVIVQFGKKRFYTGIIKNITQIKPEYEIKDLSTVLDNRPIISNIQFKLWEWIASYYMCTLGEVYKAALPSGLKLESETNISLNAEIDLSGISEKEELIIGILSKEKSLSIRKLESEAGFRIFEHVKKLVDKGIISAEEHIKQKYKAKYDDYVALNEELKDACNLNKVLDSLQRAKKQSQLLIDFIYLTKYGSNKIKGLTPGNEILKKDLLKHSEASSAQLKSLIEKGFLKIQKKEISRFGKYLKDVEISNELNEYQLKAKEEIAEQFINKDTVLLHGVTSSGKTEIYIKLIEENLAAGKQVLYLLPEIALTTQITIRLQKIFGDRLGIYHSKFNDNERVEVWRKLQDNTYKVILGVRSSVFLPFDNLGLIIVDEEHENTYKQFNPAPRYNARDVSVVLAKLYGSKVLLGTATPSIESYFNAKTGKYGLTELFTRYKEISLPEIRIADIKEATKKLQMRSLFTPQLTESLKQTLENKEQVILFQNRRGFSPFTECEICSNIPKCENCDVSLTYHKQTNHLICHYCGYSERASRNCKACGSPAMRTRGFGTQKVEDEILTLFPEVKVSRMDTDSTSRKSAYQKIIHDFETGETDILIGTQMVSKGLDFDNVGLVGIMNADNMMNFPDFRAHERSFQLMAQVSGRAGRMFKQGKVIIQTRDKDHPVLKQVVENDYQGMLMSQLNIRKQFKYPPYYRLIQLNLKHKNKDALDAASEHLAMMLKKSFGKRVLGPEYPLISWIKTWYIKTILIKLEKNISHQKAKELMLDIIDHLKGNDKFKSLQINADVDPM